MSVREMWDGQPWHEARRPPGKEARAFHGDERWQLQLLLLLTSAVLDMEMKRPQPLSHSQRVLQFSKRKMT